MWQEIVIAGVAAGAVAIGATVAIERLGGRRGGLLGTLPTTIIPASLGIWAASVDPSAYEVAMAATPAGMLLDVGFLWLWRVVPPRLPIASLQRRVLTTAALTLVAWSVGAVALALALDRLPGAANLALPLGWFLAACTAAAGVLVSRRTVASPAGRRDVPASALVLRGVMAGAAIAVAVALTRVAGPTIAGVAAVFPAIFLTTMVSLALTHGEEVPAGAIGPMMLGATSVSGFALLTTATFPFAGLLGGTVLAWVGAVVGITLPAGLWLESRSRSPRSRVDEPILAAPDTVSADERMH